MHLTLPALWPWVAALGAFVLLTVVGLPARIIGSSLLRLVIGGAVLFALDLLGRGHGIVHLGVNPITAGIVGFLGVPGLLLVIAAHMILVGSL